MRKKGFTTFVHRRFIGRLLNRLPFSMFSLSPMTRRYYVPNLTLAEGQIALPAEEAKHANRVMRVKLGDALQLFDGKGHQADAEVLSQSRNDCVCRISSVVAVSREPARRVTCGVSLPKGDRAKRLVERLTELGVCRLVPLRADRTQGGKASSSLTKLRRVVIEASKQCGRNHLMQIAEVQTVETYLSESASGHRFLAHPGGESTMAMTGISTARIFLAIGPEGGFNAEEVDRAEKCGWRLVGFGDRIYRIETATTVMATLAIHGMVSDAAQAAV